jgi:hypothetical protein
MLFWRNDNHLCIANQNQMHCQLDLCHSEHICRILFINSRLSFKTADLAHCIASTLSEITD